MPEDNTTPARPSATMDLESAAAEVVSNHLEGFTDGELKNELDRRAACRVRGTLAHGHGYFTFKASGLRKTPPDHVDSARDWLDGWDRAANEFLEDNEMNPGPKADSPTIAPSEAFPNYQEAWLRDGPGKSDA